jgi:hypothetical protein
MKMNKFKFFNMINRIVIKIIIKKIITTWAKTQFPKKKQHNMGLTKEIGMHLNTTGIIQIISTFKEKMYYHSKNKWETKIYLSLLLKQIKLLIIKTVIIKTIKIIYWTMSLKKKEKGNMISSIRERMIKKI